MLTQRLKKTYLPTLKVKNKLEIDLIFSRPYH